MKKQIFYAALFMALLSACEKQFGNSSTDRQKESDVLVLSGVKPTETSVKTYYDPASNSILWSPSGEKIRIVVSDVSDLDKGGYPKMYLMGMESKEGVVSDGGKTAKFSVPLTDDPDGEWDDRVKFPTKKGRYRVHAVYPSAAANRGLGNATPWDWLVSIGSDMDEFRQYPTANGYDPDCDVMLGISKEEYTSITKGMEVPMVYERMVTHGKITLENLPSKLQTVSEVKIVAPEDRVLVGIYYINVLDKSQSYDKGNYNTITLKYDRLGEDISNGGRKVVDGSMDLWFCTQPFELNEGESLTIIIQGKDSEGNKGVVSRTISARSEGIKFEKNKFCSLSVNMSSCPFTSLYFQVSLSKEDWKEVSEINVPRSASVTYFYVKTNIQSGFHFESQFNSAEEEFIFTEGIRRNFSGELAGDGSTIYTVYVAAKENHKVSRTTTLPYRLVFSNEGLYRDLTITQCGGTGDVVLGDWTGDYVPMDNLLWYPVNVGATEEHPYGGKYFQWGRKDGQLPWLEDNTYSVKKSVFGEDGLFVGTPDPKVTYTTDANVNPCWFNKNLDNYISVNHPFDWPAVDTAPGMGNPCPEGWRIPTIAEWERFKSSFGMGEVKTHTDGYMYNECPKWYSDIPYSLILPITGEMHFRYLEHPESYNPRFGSTSSEDAYGEYWCSDLRSFGGDKMPLALQTNGKKYKMQLYGEPTGFAVAVRCVKDNE